MRMLRNRNVDDYMEALFGKPDFSKTFIDEHGMLRTPLGDGSKRIWRLDSYPEDRWRGGKT